MPPTHSFAPAGLDRRAVLSALSFFALPPLAVAAGGSFALALEAATTGVILLHGKWLEPANLAPVTEPLQTAGFLVEAPTMPWAGSRRFDRTVDEAYDEIDAASIRLREAGAQRIVVGGHSSGGAAAFRYAALGRAVAAVVLIAPAPMIESAWFQEWVSSDLARAKDMIATGDGDKPAIFHDFTSIGHAREVTTTARRYLSYNAPDGPAALTLAAPKIGAVPMLWLAPSEDPGTEVFAQFVVPKLKADAPLERVAISGGHMDAPQASGARVAQWLTTLK